MGRVEKKEADYKRYIIFIHLVSMEKRKASMKKLVSVKKSDFMSGNIAFSEGVIAQLVKIHGVFTFCLCPGGRNAPLVSVVSQAKGLKVFSFFEERSAGFFAMGRCRRDKAPLAVITTSGTAVAELLPAVIESYYSHLPLVLITADRPSSYRGTGAPQSIEQVGIFSHYVEKTWDLESPQKFDLSSWGRKIPCHINICFSEPLMDKKIKPLVFSSPFPSLPASQPSLPLAFAPASRIKIFFSKVKKPLCIVAELSESVRENTEKVLSDFSWPVYAEAPSGLRESQKLKSVILKSGDRFLSWLISNKKIDGVLRIGGRPCARFWIDLEKTHIPVLSVSEQHYSGLGRTHPVVSFFDFFEWSKEEYDFRDRKTRYRKTLKKNTLDILKKDKKQTQVLNELLKKYPLSEPALIRKFSQKIPSRSLLFLGNSLPIREWNLAGLYHPDKELKYLCNRGANGIDGLLSSFLGSSEPDRQNWCLIGDLSCLYDLSAPWILKQMDVNMKIFLGIINNSGGQIFSSLFSDPIFLNAHALQFGKWAEMWGLNYYFVEEWPKTLSFSSPAVVELKVNPDHTKNFMQEYMMKILD